MPSRIDLGGFEIDVERTIRALRQDLKDDWFPDPLRFQDCLTHDEIIKYYDQNILVSHGVYSPERAAIFNIPKAGSLVRYSLEMNIYDRLIYHALVSHLIPYYDPLLDENSFSHRFNEGRERSGDRYTFKHPIEQFKAFEGLVKSNSDGKTVLITDVFNYYENIQLRQLKVCLEERIGSIKATPAEKMRVRRVIDLLCNFLHQWTYNGFNGLPQNRDASSFLANILMDSVDKKMRRDGFQYFRYMDDIRVICNDRNHARKALKILSETLRDIGLNLNSAKTKMGSLSDKGIAESFLIMDRTIEALDNMWRSRSSTVMKKSIPYLRGYALDLIKRKASQERGFRFAIKRIEEALRCDQLAIPDSYFNEITDKILTELDDTPASTDTMVKYLSFVQLSCDQIERLVSRLCSEECSIYSWQNYRIWLLFIARNIRSDELMCKAKELIARGGTRLPDLAGATLYVGKFGNGNDRHSIIKGFSNFKTTWIQRQALIAIHEVEFTSGVGEFVAPYTTLAAKGTYTRVRRSMRGQYVALPEPQKVKDLYDQVTVYD